MAVNTKKGTAIAQWLRCCATNRKVAGSIPVGFSGFLIDIKFFRSHYGRLSLWQKWVPGTFPGGKCDRCVRLTTLPPSCAVVMKSGNLNFLEPSGSLQACNGTDLPFPFFQYKEKSVLYSDRKHSQWRLGNLDIGLQVKKLIKYKYSFWMGAARTSRLLKERSSVIKKKSRNTNSFVKPARRITDGLSELWSGHREEDDDEDDSK